MPWLIASIVLFLALSGGAATAWLVAGGDEGDEPAPAADTADPANGDEADPAPIAADDEAERGADDGEDDADDHEEGEVGEEDPPPPVDPDHVVSVAEGALVEVHTLGCGTHDVRGTGVVTDTGEIGRAHV